MVHICALILDDAQYQLLHIYIVPYSYMFLLTEYANSSSVAFYTRPEGGHKVYKKSINCNCK